MDIPLEQSPLTETAPESILLKASHSEPHSFLELCSRRSIQTFIGSMRLHFGSVIINLEHEGEYIKFYVYNTMFGMTWNSISFILSNEEYMNMLNKKIDFSLLTADLKSKTIYQIDNMEINIDNGVIKNFQITFTDYKMDGFFINLFNLDKTTISGKNFKKKM